MNEEFTDKLGAISPKVLSRAAKERRPGAMGYAETMVLMYNGKKKNVATRLSMNKLYAKDFTVINEDYADTAPYDVLYEQIDGFDDIEGHLYLEK